MIISESIKEFKNIKNIITIIVTIILSFFVIKLFYEQGSKTIDDITTSMYALILIINVILIVKSSNIYYVEENKKTLKLMINENKRSKIIYSKMIIVLINILLYYTLMLVILIIFLKINNINNFDLSNFIKDYAVISVPSIFVSYTSFFLSIIFSSNIFPITICTFFLLLSTVIFEKMMNLGLKIFEYTFLPYLDFSIFINENTINSINEAYSINLSLRNGLIILTISLIVLYFIGMYKFERKNVN